MRALTGGRSRPCASVAEPLQLLEDLALAVAQARGQLDVERGQHVAASAALQPRQAVVAQAEHDPDARAIFITWSRTLAERVARHLTAANGAAIVTRTPDEAIALANRIAPEHLVVDREALTRRSLTAGAVFVGPYTAQAAGDYATGSNHVLPTSGAARFRGGLTAADFVRVMSVQRLTRAGLARLAPTILPLARAEGLEAHARSIEIRLGGHQP